MRGKVPSPRFAPSLSKDVQSGTNCSMFFQCVLQTSDEGSFQNVEALGWSPSCAELFAQLLRRPAPKRVQVHMNIGEFTCRNAQEAKRAAGPEMHTDDVLP